MHINCALQSVHIATEMHTSLPLSLYTAATISVGLEQKYNLNFLLKDHRIALHENSKFEDETSETKPLPQSITISNRAILYSHLHVINLRKIVYNFDCFIAAAAVAVTNIAQNASDADAVMIFQMPNALTVQRVQLLCACLCLIFFSCGTEIAHVCTFENCVRRYSMHMASHVMRRCQWKKDTMMLMMMMTEHSEHRTHPKSSQTQTHTHTEKPQKLSSDTKCEREKRRKVRKRKNTHTKSKYKQTNCANMHGTPILYFQQLDYEQQLHSAAADDNDVFICYSFSLSYYICVCVCVSGSFFKFSKTFHALPSVPVSYSIAPE